MDPQNIRCRIIIGIQKGTMMLTTTHIEYRLTGFGFTTKHYKVRFRYVQEYRRANGKHVGYYGGRYLKP